MTKKHYLLITFLFTFLSAQEGLAQFRVGNLFGGENGRKPHKNKTFQAYSTISFGGGSSSYYGDLSPYNRFLQSTINGIRWNANFNYTRQMSPTFGLRFGLTWARISGDDNYMDGVPKFEVNFIRNLHVRNDIKELSVIGEYDLVRTERSYNRRAAIVPYLLGGVAVFAHDPMAKTPTSTIAGVPSNEWVRLQPLATEGVTYSLIGVAIPVGVGVRYKMNKNWDFGFEVGYRYTFTDYLDDVSGNYPDPTQLTSTLAQVMSNRTLEKTAANRGTDRTAGVSAFLTANGIPFSGDPFANPIPGFTSDTDPRGSPKLKDAYMLTTIKLIYHIEPKIKCPGVR